MRAAAKKAGTTKRWSSRRCSPSGKRISCCSNSARRNSLCGVEEPERHVGRGEAVPVDEAEGGRSPAAVPDHLADDDVGAVLRRGGVEALQRGRLKPVVVVGEEHELAARRLQTH